MVANAWYGLCSDKHEVRRINRKVLIEILRSHLPDGTIRYSAKVVHIQESGFCKSIHLADGTVLKTKVMKLSGYNILNFL